LGLLSKYNGGKPLNKDLISRIEDHFDYYWANNRLSALTTDIDKKFLKGLPEYIQSDIFVDYIFSDFLYRYRNYFRPESHVWKLKKKNIYAQDPEQKAFLVEFVQKLEPRIYDQSKNEMIQD
jgi:hypothetical protein